MKIDHISQLLPDPKNARRHTPRNVGMIVDSLHRVGAARSIVIDEEGVILAGNATVDAAGEAGIERVRVIEADGHEIIAVQRKGLTKQQKTDLALSDNRSAELAEWDEEVLARISAETDLSPLFYPEELSALLQTLNIESPDAGASSGTSSGSGGEGVGESAGREGTRSIELGDLWQLGDHRLLCGDSTDSALLSSLLALETPRMVFADPPYGCNIVLPRSRDSEGNVEGIVASSHLKAAGRYRPMAGDDSTETARAAHALCTSRWPDAVQIWWGGPYYSDALPPSSCWIVWDKENTANFADAELAWTNRTTAIRIFRHMWNGLCRDSENQEKRIHPTQKPVALARWCFEKYGSPGDLILDPFAGSGMTFLAAHETNRRVFGVELSPEYCEAILTRWEAATGIAPRLLNNLGTGTK